MNAPYANIAYARLDIDFDQDLFVKEYDEMIIDHPLSYSAANSVDSVNHTQNVNKSWGMVDPEKYTTCDVTVAYQNIEKRQHRQWTMTQMMVSKPSKDLNPILAVESQRGGAYARNNLMDEFWVIRPEFKNLEITRWILKNIPFKKFVAIHCVSLEPGNWASIHRDMRHWDKDVDNPGLNNGLYQKGLVVINLNISSGGAPLYWSLDGDDVFKPPLLADDKCYMTSDYFLHGVPAVTSRRRQIRITGVPTDRLTQYIDYSTAVKLEDNYKFDSEENLYPG